IGPARPRTNRAAAVASPMRPAPPSRVKSGQNSPRTVVSSCKSSLSPLADQAFLRHRSDKRPVAPEYKSACKAARAVQVRRILRIRQPVIGTKRPVKPQRMIEARPHESLFEQRSAMWREPGIEKHHIGGVGQYALMDGGKVWQFTGGPDPDIELSA